MLKAGFVDVDITPRLGTKKIGWLKEIVPTRVANPLFARAAVFETPRQRLAILSLDTLFVRTEETAAIRRGVEQKHGFPGANLLVAATHNHGGPAVAECGDVRVDEGYCASMVDRCVKAIGDAIRRTEDAEIAFGSRALFGVGFNRRVIMRDGTVRTHGTFEDANALCLEGPIDPELSVLAVRRTAGGRDLLGAVVNYANHPTDHGGDDCFSAGWPGVLQDRMKQHGCPQTLFLNGAYGNVSAADPTRSGQSMSMRQIGDAMADAVRQVLAELGAKPQRFAGEVQLSSRSLSVALPYRAVTDAEIRGTVRGAQRFIDPAIYDRNIPRVLEEIERNKGRIGAEVQALGFDDHVYLTVPAELFVQLGLRIKEQAHPRRALVVGSANGIVGYAPHADAFPRGGYETTFIGTSKLAPGAGEMLADCAATLARGG
jgi:hypothetical protein